MVARKTHMTGRWLWAQSTHVCTHAHAHAHTQHAQEMHAVGGCTHSARINNGWLLMMRTNEWSMIIPCKAQTGWSMAAREVHTHPWSVAQSTHTHTSMACGTLGWWHQLKAHAGVGQVTMHDTGCQHELQIIWCAAVT